MKDRRSPSQREFDDRPLLFHPPARRRGAPLWVLGLVVVAGIVVQCLVDWIG